MKELFSKIENELNDKKIILIAGASSSGKTFMAEKLKDYLSQKGKRVLQFSCDMYYKGISRIITEKTFLHNVEFLKYSNLCASIYNNVREIIEDDEFSNKFCDRNFLKINEYLKTIMPLFVAENFAIKLKEEFNNINFDEPFCINFNQLSSDIEKLINKDSIYIPKYSFSSGEATIDKSKKTSGLDFDVIIVEGLYTLRDDLLTKLNCNQILKVGINCDNKTLLSRRFNRDINSDRVSFTPEQTIMLFISKVMPAYYSYIYPTLTNADIIYNASLSNIEIINSQKSIQIKYMAPQNLSKTLKNIGAKLLSTTNQKDYFLEDVSGNLNNIVLRIREENGYATKLTLKIKTSKLERAVQEYNLEKLLSKENREIVKLLNLFKSSGYETSQMVTKTRKTYQVIDKKIKVDFVKDLGVFVEIDSDSLNEFGKIKAILNLDNPTTTSYYEMYVNSLKNLKHNECEIKYVVENLPEENLKKIFKEHNIKQFYLNLQNNNVLQNIDKTFNKAFNLNDIAEARVRLVNGSDAFLTLKSNGLKVRDEIEKEIPIPFAKDLIKYSKSYVEKTRYKIFEHKGKKVEMDYYKNRDLCVMEVEYDENELMEDDINSFVNTLFKDDVKILNVTNDYEYKNKNLAEDLGENNADEQSKI